MVLSVVIVNYNVKYFLEQCIRSVSRATEDIATEIFVVDNASSDGSLEYLKPRFPNVKFIANDENVGFSKANNMAIRQATGKYVLLLNPDTFVGENVFRECLRVMESNEKAGGIGVKMLNSNGSFAFESRRGLPTPMTSFYKISGLCNRFPYSRLFGKYYLRYLDENEVNRIDIISGAFMWLRREALNKSGLLDETFFMYGEDVDMSYRITKSGYENYYVPAPILHYKGESTKKDSFRYVYVFYEAMVIFFKKHYPHYSGIFSLGIKATIYMRASLAVFSRMFKRCKRAIGIKSPEPELRFLVLGSEKALRDVRYICRKNKLDNRHHYVMANEASTPGGHLKLGINLSDYTHVVYDTDSYSYARVLELLSQSSSSGKIELGTYSTTSKVLIIPQQIYL